MLEAQDEPSGAGAIARHADERVLDVGAVARVCSTTLYKACASKWDTPLKFDDRHVSQRQAVGRWCHHDRAE